MNALGRTAWSLFILTAVGALVGIPTLAFTGHL